MLSDEGLRERRWGMFPTLRLALENRSLPDGYYGWTSISDNVFKRLPRVVEVGLLALESKDHIREVASKVGWDEMHRDLDTLSSELRSIGELLTQASRDVYSLHGLQNDADTSGGDEARVTANFDAFKTAMRFVLNAPRSSNAQITVAFRAHELIFTRRKTEASVPAVGDWHGRASFYDNGLLKKLDHIKVADDTIVIRVNDGRIVMGECVVACDWEATTPR
jgi:hypothetical protein